MDKALVNEEAIVKYVDEICSENLEYRNDRWCLRYGDDSYCSTEIVDILVSSFNISANEAKQYVRNWKIAEITRIEELEDQRMEEVVNFPIPEKVQVLLERMEKLFGISLEFNEHPISLYNRGGYQYAIAKGIVLSHRTSSLADGPDPDYSKEIMDILKAFDFEVVNSYGDNGMDWSTNWHDTYWYNEIIYSPSIIYL